MVLTAIVNGIDRLLPARTERRLMLGLLLTLLAVDVVFIELHRLYLQGVLGAAFSIDSEAAYSEQYQHGKELVAAVAAASLLLKSGEMLYACWTGLFGYMLVDDTLQLHEHFGTWLSGVRPGPVFGLPAQAFGELTVSAMAGSTFLALLFWGWKRSGVHARRLSAALLAGLVALAFVGVGVDAVHSLVRVDPWRYRLGIIEEGGELIMVSALVSLVSVAAFFTRTQPGTVVRTHRDPHGRVPS